MSIKVKDLLPLIWYNDIRLVVGANEEVCLIRKDFNKKYFPTSVSIWK